MKFRDANTTDVEAIADLHAKSWRSTYAGILSAQFLESDVHAERRASWRERLAADGAPWVRLAVERGALLGFVSVCRADDASLGAHLENLHVRSDTRGKGIGRALMGEAADWVLKHQPRGTMYLWVYEANTGARGFYESLGGDSVEWMLRLAPDGSRIASIRYLWRDLRALLHTSRNAVSPLR